ncbi:Argonaute 1 [Tribonema minus]|uniref:Argonaute 1 n=1 Tax=Tribonema minus TaxID=303371 RepID=A0A836CL74_9STRA|nr:Argonaute 1 [Tribonema minus]
MSALRTTPVEQISFCARPGYAQKGRTTALFANHYKVDFNPAAIVQQYDFKLEGIDINDMPSKKLKTIMKAVIKQRRETFGDARLAFDGRSIVYASKMLPFDNEVTVECEIEDERSTDRPPRKYMVKLLYTAERPLTEMQAFLRGERRESAVDVINALDVVLRTVPTMKLVSAGRNFYMPTSDYPISGGAEVWLGYNQSLRPGQAGTTFNADLAASAFLKVMPVMEFICQQLNCRDPRQLQQALGDMRGQKQASKAIATLAITVNHRPTKRTFRVSGLSRTPASGTFIQLEGGKQGPSVADYFKEKYKKQGLQFPHLPCIRIGSAAKSNFLPIEVCDVAPGHRFTNAGLKLSDRQTADLIKIACRRPEERRGLVHNQLGMLMGELNEHAHDFGMRVHNKAIAMTGHILPVPEIKYANGNERPSAGKWNMMGKKFSEAAELACWAIICMCGPRDMQLNDVQQFAVNFVSNAKKIGMKVSMERPPIMMMFDERLSIPDAMQSAFDQAAKAGRRPKPQLLLCIMPVKPFPDYPQVKLVGDTQLGVATQLLWVKHARDGKPTVLANVLLKVNAKIGGRNAADCTYQRTTCVIVCVCADVHHASPGSSRPSIAAVVASLDNQFVRHAACVRVQGPRKEIIEDLAGMVRKLIMLFHSINRVYPQKVVFLRDGVSEGQFRQVLKLEVRAIEEACRSISSDYRPLITFLTCQKRHHTRIYAVNAQDQDQSGNTQAGTVVDTAICHPTEFDFFLCSHGGLQGTSRPTKYSVLWDEMNFSPDQIQKLIYELCYLQARCTRSVSIPPAVYYAHLAAFRAQHFVQDMDIESQSAISGRSGGSGSAISIDWSERFTNVHEDLTNVMYFV